MRNGRQGNWEGKKAGGERRNVSRGRMRQNKDGKEKEGVGIFYD